MGIMTETITLRTAFANYPHVRAIKDGSVASPRIRFDFEEVPVITRAFRRDDYLPRTGRDPTRRTQTRLSWICRQAPRPQTR